MTNKTETFSGHVSDLKTIATRTGRSMVTFTVNGRKCKAFGDVADTCAALDGKEVKIEAREGSFRGEKEYAVISVKGKLDGQEVSKTDTRSAAVGTKHSKGVERLFADGRPLGRHREIVGRRENPIGVWVNKFFDNLTDEEWLEWRKARDAHWPRLPSETRQHLEETSSCVPGNEYKILPSVRERFETRLNEVHSRFNSNAEAHEAPHRPPSPARPASSPLAERVDLDHSGEVECAQ